MLALVSSKPTLEWPRTSRHMCVEVRWDLVNKLYYLATPHFASASSLEGVTAVVVACQQTYDAFIKISKALNKAASLQRSVTTNLSKLLESMPRQIHIVNASIRTDAIDKASNKTLKYPGQNLTKVSRRRASAWMTVSIWVTSWRNSLGLSNGK